MKKTLHFLTNALCSKANVMVIVLCFLCVAHVVARVAKITTKQRYNTPTVNSKSAYPGFVLFAPKEDTNTYLIDKDGYIKNEWHSSFTPGMSVYLLPDGNLLRAENTSPNYCGAPGGQITLYDWYSNVIWTYPFSSYNYQQSHDIYPINDSDVLVDVWERIDSNSLPKIKNYPSSNCLNCSILQSGGAIWSGKVVELKAHPSQQTVWQSWSWRFWDHLISSNNPQDIAAHPEKMNVNSPSVRMGGNADWIHMNAITYNPELDQILISSRNLSEFYIIDHDHGKDSVVSSGKKGDFLYRWGNPQEYNIAPAIQQLFGQHSPYWIPKHLPCSDKKLPYAGKIMAFNDGYNQCPGLTGQACSTAVVIVDPGAKNGVYPRPPHGSAFGPAMPSFNDTLASQFWNATRGSAQQLPNGNIICSSPDVNLLYEINASNTVVWQMTTTAGMNGAFRCELYEKKYVESAEKSQSKPKPKK